MRYAVMVSILFLAPGIGSAQVIGGAQITRGAPEEGVLLSLADAGLEAAPLDGIKDGYLVKGEQASAVVQALSEVPDDECRMVSDRQIAPGVEMEQVSIHCGPDHRVTVSYFRTEEEGEHVSVSETWAMTGSLDLSRGRQAGSGTGGEFRAAAFPPPPAGVDTASLVRHVLGQDAPRFSRFHDHQGLDGMR